MPLNVISRMERMYDRNFGEKSYTISIWCSNALHFCWFIFRKKSFRKKRKSEKENRTKCVWRDNFNSVVISLSSKCLTKKMSRSKINEHWVILKGIRYKWKHCHQTSDNNLFSRCLLYCSVYFMGRLKKRKNDTFFSIEVDKISFRKMLTPAANNNATQKKKKNRRIQVKTLLGCHSKMCESVVQPFFLFIFIRWDIFHSSNIPEWKPLSSSIDNIMDGK